MEVTGLSFAGTEQLTSIVATVYDYKCILVWDDVI